LFIFEHHAGERRSAMAREDESSPLLNSLFREAVRRHGGDLTGVLGEVKAQIAALSDADRVAIYAAFERLLAFRGPDHGGRRLH
jgi:hypothetical protein